LAAVPALVHLLDPRGFGLVAMVTFITGLVAMPVDAATSTAAILRDYVAQ